jgi:hypothetical protein
MSTDEKAERAIKVVEELLKELDRLYERTSRDLDSDALGERLHRWQHRAIKVRLMYSQCALPSHQCTFLGSNGAWPVSHLALLHRLPHRDAGHAGGPLDRPAERCGAPHRPRRRYGRGPRVGHHPRHCAPMHAFRGGPSQGTDDCHHRSAMHRCRVSCEPPGRVPRSHRHRCVWSRGRSPRHGTRPCPAR